MAANFAVRSGLYRSSQNPPFPVDRCGVSLPGATPKTAERAGRTRAWGHLPPMEHWQRKEGGFSVFESVTIDNCFSNPFRIVEDKSTLVSSNLELNHFGIAPTLFVGNERLRNREGNCS